MIRLLDTLGLSVWLWANRLSLLLQKLGSGIFPSSHSVNGSLHGKSPNKVHTLIAVAIGCFIVDATTADDTEVFFGGGGASPNVLFIVDVSGSMRATDGAPLPSIPNNVLWLDAADRNTLLDARGNRASNWRRFSGSVSRWLDKSGKGNHLTGTSARLADINGVTSVRFTRDIMSGPDIFDGSMSEATIFLIQQENVRSSNFFLSFNGSNFNSSGRVSFHTPWSNGNWYWDAGGAGGERSRLSNVAAVGDVTQLTAYKTVAGNENGISVNSGAFNAIGSGATAADTKGGVYLGTNAVDHELAELIVYDRKLSGEEIKTVQEHLDRKWRTRLDRVKIALNSLLETNDGFNAGLMTYSSYSRGQFSLRDEIKPVIESKESLQGHINALYASGGTPTQSAMFEGMRYFRGERPLAMGGIRSSGQPPMEQCQSNHIVLLTDGLPYGGGELRTIERYIGSNCARNQGANRRYGNCGIELAQYMHDNDHYPGVEGTNNITTHTIGLSLDLDWLGNIAAAGGGGYYSVESSEQLVSAFESIVNVAIDQATTFVAPSVTVDQFSRLAHRDDAYLALFQPTSSMRWEGNLKRYRFGGNPVAIRDQNNKEALDNTAGLFYSDSQSFWSDSPDGASTSQGGAVSKLNVATRQVTTYTGLGTKDLLDIKNRVHEANSSNLAGWFNVTGSELSNLLAWARGVDVDDEDSDGSSVDTRHSMGDPLHSQPLIVNYGGTSANPDSVVFVGTNEGYLHAINSRDGMEIYSFIPPQLLGNLNTFYQNETGTDRPYGLDGDITLWLDDKNRNGMVDPTTEHAYLYVGMRRGGRNYYALDISEKGSPKYLWTIEGGRGDFAELGQSWSKPVKTRIILADRVRDVLIFGGGYDPAQDDRSVRSADSFGNTVFVVDAGDGSLIWKTSLDRKSDYSKMIYSIPSDPGVMDLDGDGIIDQMYIGDMGGQLWRFDFRQDATSAADLVSGGLIADLATSDAKNSRRFFYPPDLALVVRHGVRFLSLAIGSGNRAHPLDKQVEDRFYMIQQKDVYKIPEGYGVKVPAYNGSPEFYRPVTEDDLFDATTNDVDNEDTIIALAARQELDDARGWMLKLQASGEKVLGESVTIDHNIVFATYLPTTRGNATTDCQAAVGGNRGYVVSLYDASPLSGENPSDRNQDLEQGGITGAISVIINHNNTDGQWSVNAITGLDSLKIPNVNLTKRVYWSENPDF
ncbi:hypothetical protein AB833_24595 [Chromatiales bacterium (ex Bugula neritina AB1)]|nr:hypothetical protein AB833_24595 [Chromatiales bacterium (ex Bugula neritina AB1)]